MSSELVPVWHTKPKVLVEETVLVLFPHPPSNAVGIALVGVVTGRVVRISSIPKCGVNLYNG